MENPLLTHPVPPLLLSAARRLLDAMTVDLDSSTFSASGEIGAFLRLKAGETEASLTLRSGPTGLLASCSLCRTEGELPCTHAIAVLLVFRERSSSRETRKTIGRTPPLPLGHPAKTEESLQDFPCTTLLLSGTREAPFFVALTRRMTPMDHARFHLLESGKKGSGKDLSPPAELFSGAFAPHLAKGRDGSLIPGYRPRSGGRDALFRYLSLPGIRILSARTKSPYRIECPPTPPLRSDCRPLEGSSGGGGGPRGLGRNRPSRPLPEGCPLDELRRGLDSRGRRLAPFLCEGLLPDVPQRASSGARRRPPPPSPLGMGPLIRSRQSGRGARAPRLRPSRPCPPVRVPLPVDTGPATRRPARRRTPPDP